MSRKVSTEARGSGERRLARSLPGWLRVHREQRPDRAQRDLDVLRPAGGGRDPLGDDLAEARVGGVLRDAEPLRERQRTEVEVLRAPAEQGGVEGDHERAGADRLGPLDQAVDEPLVGAPVELDPARRVAHRRGAVLHRVRSPGWRRRTARRSRRPRARSRRSLSAADQARPRRPVRAAAARRAGVPSRSTDRSRSATPCAIRGTIAQRSNAARLCRIVRPSPAPPAT